MLPFARIAAKPRAGRARGGMPPAAWSLSFPSPAGRGFRLGLPVLLATPEVVFDRLPVGLREELAAHLLQQALKVSKSVSWPAVQQKGVRMSAECSGRARGYKRAEPSIHVSSWGE